MLGDLGILLLHRDETARRAAEQAAAAHLARLEDQRREILALSAPLLVCGDRTIVAPLIGHLDEPRSRDISERLLLTIAERRIRRVVLDLTGLVDLDLPAAQRLRELLAAVRLLGAAPILTGLRPALAANLVASGVDLQGERFHRSLADILALR